MKLSGISGTGSGKLGSMVYSVQKGTQLVRQYNPEVANPSTNGQVAQRARFKLMSQLAAAMAPVIAIKRDRNISARNQFVAGNIGLTSFANDEATIRLNLVQLTKSAVGLPDFEVDRLENEPIYCRLEDPAPMNVVGMVYSAFVKNADGTLAYHDSVVASVAGENRYFGGNMRYTDKEVVIYAYGVLSSEASASAAYGNLEALSAEQVAKIIANRSLSAGAASATKTKGLTMLEGEAYGSSQSDDRLVVAVAISGHGTVQGAGRYNPNDTCTLVATPTGEAVFLGFYSGSQLLSSNPSYSFTVVDDISITARFQDPAARYQIAASADPVAGGNVSGAGTYEDGQSCTLIATAASGYRFVAWKENGSVVSSSASLTFTVSAARTLVAEFEEYHEGFDNVTLNGAAWDGNKTEQSHFAATGSYVGEGVKVCVIDSATQPNVGATFTSHIHDVNDITSGSFSIPSSLLGQDGIKYWLVAGSGDSSSFTIATVYPYYCQEEEVIS